NHTTPPHLSPLSLHDALPIFTRVPSRRRPHLGIARTYQIITLFPRETLLRNVTLSLLGLSRLRWNPFVRLERQGALIAGAREALDRKSTRLNSSHLVISYAVF